MNVNEACIKFRLSKKEIYKRRKDNMIIGVYKSQGRLIIPDDTLIIPSKGEIRSFLVQVLKHKNNNSFVVSRELCPDNNKLKALVDYLYKRGFVGETRYVSNVNELFRSMQITDSGFVFLFGEALVRKTSNDSLSSISINPDFNFSIIKMGVKI